MGYNDKILFELQSMIEGHLKVQGNPDAEIIGQMVREKRQNYSFGGLRKLFRRLLGKPIAYQLKMEGMYDDKWGDFVTKITITDNNENTIFYGWRYSNGYLEIDGFPAMSWSEEYGPQYGMPKKEWYEGRFIYPDAGIKELEQVLVWNAMLYHFKPGGELNHRVEIIHSPGEITAIFRRAQGEIYGATVKYSHLLTKVSADEYAVRKIN